MSNLSVKLCSKYYFSCYYEIYYTFIKLTTRATWIERTRFQIPNTRKIGTIRILFFSFFLFFFFFYK